MNINFWLSARGENPVKVFIEGLQKAEIKKVQATIDRLERYGRDPLIKVNTIEPVPGYKGLYAIRVRPMGVFIRIFCFFKENVCCLLHGYKKKDNRMDPKEILKAYNRMILQREGNRKV